MKKLLLIFTGFIFLGCDDGECIVTGNKLGSMGKPVSFGHEGKKYWVCCSPCIEKFKKDPAKYLND